MSYNVIFAEAAVKDLKEIISYISEKDSTSRATAVRTGILNAARELRKMPDRGSIPDELIAVGKNPYREIFYKPYRIIYRVESENVQVHIIADGRRNLQDLVRKRLTRD